MSLTIDDPKTERLARALARRTGESVGQAVETALRERMERLDGPVPDEQALFERLMSLSECSARMPDLDRRRDEEIIGYDETGAFRPW